MEANRIDPLNWIALDPISVTFLSLNGTIFWRHMALQASRGSNAPQNSARQTRYELLYAQ